MQLQGPHLVGRVTITQRTAESSGSEPHASIPRELPGASLQLSNHCSGLGGMFPACPLPASQGLPCPWPYISQSWASGQPAALGPVNPAIQGLGSNSLFCLSVRAACGSWLILQGALSRLGLGLQGHGQTGGSRAVLGSCVGWRAGLLPKQEAGV